jgi:hypothetical protein
MLRLIEAQQSLQIAVHHRTGGDHFGVQQGVTGQQTMEKPAVTVSPVHHRRHGKLPGQIVFVLIHLKNRTAYGQLASPDWA